MSWTFVTWALKSWTFSGIKKRSLLWPKNKMARVTCIYVYHICVYLQFFNISVFAVFMFVSSFICLSICLFVCLLLMEINIKIILLRSKDMSQRLYGLTSRQIIHVLTHTSLMLFMKTHFFKMKFCWNINVFYFLFKLYLSENENKTRSIEWKTDYNYTFQVSLIFFNEFI